MEHYKKSNILNDSTALTFSVKKWIEINDLWGGQYYVKKNTRFKTWMFLWKLCCYSYAYIVVKETIDLLADTSNENV